MLILVVEDDARVASFLSRGLSEEGYTVDVCTRGDLAVEQGLAQPYDLVLLDWGLPGLDGVSLLRRWRSAGLDVPVVMLTARSGVDAAVLALDGGADDYIEKPFHLETLLAKVRAHERRRRPGAQVQIGACTVDTRRRTVNQGGTEVELSSREFALLDLLLRHRGDVVARGLILDRVWGMSHDPTTNVVDVYVRYLRQKLDAPSVGPDASCIETVRGKGYRLRADP